MEKEIWKGLIQISQDAPIEEGILGILSRVPSNGVHEDVRKWFNTKNSDRKVMDEDFFTFLQQRAMAIAHEMPKHTPPPTLVPNSDSILADAQTSLDVIQKSTAWQQLGVEPALLTQPIFAPRTPNPPCPIIDTSTSPSPHILTSPLLSIDNVEMDNIGENNCNPLPLDRDASSPTGRLLKGLDTHVMGVRLSPPLPGDYMHEDGGNPSLLTRHEVAMAIDDDSEQQFPQDVAMELDSEGSQPANICPLERNDHPHTHDGDVPPSEPTHPVPIELENNTLSVASISPPTSPIQSRSSNKVDDVQGLSSDDEDQQSDAVKALAKTLNKAINMNTSQHGPETDRWNNEVTIQKPPDLQKNKAQGKANHEANKLSSAVASSSKNNQDLERVPRIEPKYKNEVIDLTLEEVSCSILFRPESKR